MNQLVDPFGRPVRKKVLTLPQAEPGLASVRSAWATSVASGLTPARLAGILRACDEGDLQDFLILAEEMEERDPHYAAVLGSRKRAISSVPPRVEPVSESAADKRIAEAVEQRIAEHDGFADLVEDLLDAIGKGFAVVEIDWKSSASEWWPRAFVWRDPRFFSFDQETGQELRLRDEQDMAHGIELAPFKFIQHRARLKSGLPFRSGVARVVAFTWMCKAYDLKDWMAFIETYGLPLRLGRYDGSATKEDVEKLFTAVANIGTDAAAVLPKSMDIDFENTGTVTGDQLFENLARYLDEQVSKAVLGQTMTSDDGSSQAQAKVHNDVRYDIAAADARAIEGTLNRDLVRPFVDLNFGRQDSYPRLKLHIEEPEDTDMVMRNVYRLASTGVAFKQSELRNRLGFSEPERGDDIVGSLGEGVRRSDLNREDDGGADDLDEIEAEMLEDWEDVMDPILEPIRAAIEGATSYEDALERIEAAAPNIATGAMIETLVKGMFKARAIGDVRDD
ncbi:DUF935 domain-containing protein [Pseudaestuariivita sp.]|uniref:DUF935 domain-containing protein n=1 Tax=Pseudaestuariivita sp. TaxID=2211669 RepID=UPI004059956A